MHRRIVSIALVLMMLLTGIPNIVTAAAPADIEHEETVTDETLENWAVTGNNTPLYELTENGFEQKAVKRLEVRNKNYTPTGSYIMDTVVRRQKQNYINVFFNSTDAKQYYIKIISKKGENDTVQLIKKEKTESVIAESQASGQIPDAEITVRICYDADGFVSALISTDGENTFDKVLDSVALNEKNEQGYFGARLEYTKGYIKKFTFYKPLSAALDTSVDADSFDIGDEIKIVFDKAVNAVSLNTENVTVRKNGEELDGAMYTVAQSDDKQSAQITFHDGAIDYEDELEVILGIGIFIDGENFGLPAQKKIAVKVRDLPFDYRFTDDVGGDFSNNINKKVSVDAQIINSYFDDETECLAVLTLDNPGGKCVWAEEYSVKLLAGVNKVGGEEGISLIVPEQVETGAKLNMLVLNRDGTKMMFPVRSYDGENRGIDPQYKIDGETITISGKTESGQPNRRVVLVLRESTTQEIVKAEQILTNKDGEYAFSFVLNAAEGTFDYSVGEDDAAEAKTGSFSYLSAQSKNELIESINKADSAEEFAGLVSESLLKLGIATDKFMNQIDMQLFCSAVMEMRPFHESDEAKSYAEQMRQALGLQAFKQGRPEILFDSNNKFSGDEYCGFCDMDSKSGLDIVALFNNHLTDGGRANVVKALKKYSEIDRLNDAYDAFAKETVLYGLTNWKDEGSSHIKAYLNQYAKLVGFDLLYYNDLSDTSAIDEKIAAHRDFASADEFNAFLRGELEQYDVAAYTYNFSSKDKTDSDWDISFTKGTVSYTDGNGLYSTELLRGRAISPMAVSGDYSVKMTGSKSYNRFRLYYCFTDDSNTYYVDVEPAQVSIKKVKDGKETTIVPAKAIGITTNAEVDVEVIYSTLNGVSVVVKSGDKAVYPISNVKDSTFTSGKFGCGIWDTPGYLKGMVLSRYLLPDDGAFDRQDVSVDKPIKIGFNYMIDEDTLNADKIGLYRLADNGEIALREVKADGKKLILTPSETLDYKTQYSIRIDREACRVKNSSAGLMSDIDIGFRTEANVIDVTEFYGNVGDETVFSQDMSVYNGTYTSNADLSSMNGQNVDVYLKIKNSAAATKNARVIVSLLNADGETVETKTAVTTLSANRELYVGKDGASVTAIPLESFSIPDHLGEGASFRFIVLDHDKLNTLYPKESACGRTEYRATLTYDAVEITGAAAYGEIIPVAIYDADHQLYCAEYAIADRDGNFSIRLPMNTANLQSGVFEVCVGNGSDIQKLYIANDADKNETVKAVNLGSVSEIAQILGSDPDILGVSNTKAMIFKLLDKNEIAQFVYDRVKNAKFDETDGADTLQRYIDQACTLLAYYHGLDAMLYGADGEFLTDYVIDPRKDAEVYEVYENQLSKDGQKNVRTNLMGNRYKEEREWFEKLNEQVLIHGIINCSRDGIAQINGLLHSIGSKTNPTLNLRGYDALGKTDQNWVDLQLLTGGYSNITELQSKIDAYVKEKTQTAEPSTPSSGGSGGGGRTVSADISHAVSGGVSESTDQNETFFRDLSGFDWAKDAIHTLARADIINGDGNGNFNPGASIKREEFVKMIVLAFGLKPVRRDVAFSDVDQNAWYYDYVCAAADLGIVNGIGDNQFGTGEPISREEVCTIIYRALQASEEADDYLSGFSDRDEISEWALSALNYLVSKNVINGVTKDKIAPDDFCNRAQTAKIVCLALQINR